MSNFKKNKNWISLQEATKFCNYSQEYLSLLARKGILRAVKFQRNWMSSHDAVREYMEKHQVRQR